MPKEILAQQSSSELTITGTVQDKHSGEPVIHASAAVYTIDDSTLVTGAITDDEGFFSIEGLNQNNYRVRISYMGYQTRYLQYPIHLADSRYLIRQHQAALSCSIC